MAEPIADRVAFVRDALSRNEKAWGAYGHIGPGFVGNLPADVPESYAQFLRLSNGCQCGDLVMFDYPLVEDMQFNVATASEFYDNVQPSEWFCFGVNGDDPILLSRQTARVWYFPDTGVGWKYGGRFEPLAAGIDEFTVDYAMGEKYSVICPRESGPWLGVLRTLGLHGG